MPRRKVNRGYRRTRAPIKEACRGRSRSNINVVVGSEGSGSIGRITLGKMVTCTACAIVEKDVVHLIVRCWRTKSALTRICIIGARTYSADQHRIEVGTKRFGGIAEIPDSIDRLSVCKTGNDGDHVVRDVH